jgi:rubrerythrin
MTDQVEKLRQLAAEAARNAAMSMPPDYRIHRVGKEIRAKLKAEFPATDFFIATSDGFDTMHGEFPPMIEIQWNDGPSVSALRETLQGNRGKDFEFDVLFSHGFTCRVCGQARGSTIYDSPGKCTVCGDDFNQW